MLNALKTMAGAVLSELDARLAAGGLHNARGAVRDNERRRELTDLGETLDHPPDASHKSA